MEEARSSLGAELSAIAKLLNAHYHAPIYPIALRKKKKRQLKHANPLVQVMNVSTQQRVSPFAFRMQIEFNHTQELFPHVVLQPRCGQLLSLPPALMHCYSSIIIGLEIENEYQF